MTFTEAAIEVLRLTGKPLHYKKITELAIQKNLLSHVGKTPEITMSSRLATLVKKDRDESLIIKVKPGVFGLRDFGRDVIAAAEKELPDDPHAAELEAQAEALAAQADEEEQSVEPKAEAAAPEPKKPAKPLPGQEMFPEEEDDDVPILGGPDKDEAKAGGGQPGGGGGGDRGEGRGRRRRRRGRGRGGDEGAEVRGGEGGGGGGAESPSPERETRPEGRSEGRSESRGGRDRDRDRDRGRDDRGRSRDDRGPSRDDMVRGDPNREHEDGELVGKELADAVATVLAAGEHRPQPLVRVAEMLVHRGRLAGDPSTLTPTVAAAIRADLARRESENVRPRFRLAQGRVVLTDWSLPPEAIRFEQDAVRAADRQRDMVRQAFLRRVRELGGAGFAELLATWLNAEGVVALRAVRRPGAQPGELHLAGTLKRGHDETRLAIVARKDGRELSRERVIEVRGALHHYGSASASWMITTGQVLSGAREEAAVAGVAPVALFDGVGLARAMERASVGLRRHVVPLATLDVDLLDALRGDQPAPRDDRGPRRDDRGPRRDERGPGAPMGGDEPRTEETAAPQEGSRSQEPAPARDDDGTEDARETAEELAAQQAMVTERPTGDDGPDESDDDDDDALAPPADDGDDAPDAADEGDDAADDEA